MSNTSMLSESLHKTNTNFNTIWINDRHDFRPTFRNLINKMARFEHRISGQDSELQRLYYLHYLCLTEENGYVHGARPAMSLTKIMKSAVANPTQSSTVYQHRDQRQENLF